MADNFNQSSNTTTELTSLVGRVFDGTTEAWSDYQKDYAGKTLYLQEQFRSRADIRKSGFLHMGLAKQYVSTGCGTRCRNGCGGHTVRGTDSANGKWLCTVHMGWTGRAQLYKYSNIQYTDENTAGNESTPLSITTQNRFIYGAEGSVDMG